MARKLPHILPGTLRQWRVRKRRELRDVSRALDALRLGCAYSPIRQEVEHIQTAVDSARQKLRGNWEPRG
jgi:hypothetical protein